MSNPAMISVERIEYLWRLPVGLNEREAVDRDLSGN